MPDLDKLVRKAQVQINKAQMRQVLYYNTKRRELEVKGGDFVMLEKHWLSERHQKRVAKFDPKFDGTFRGLDLVNNNLIIVVEDERTTVNLDQVRDMLFQFSSHSLTAKPFLL